MSKVNGIPRTFTKGKAVTPTAPYPDQDTPTSQAGQILLPIEAEWRLDALKTAVETLKTQVATLEVEIAAIEQQLGPPLRIPGNPGQPSPLLILGDPSGSGGNGGLDIHDINGFLSGQIHAGSDAVGSGADSIMIATDWLNLGRVDGTANPMVIYPLAPIEWYVTGYPFDFWNFSSTGFRAQAPTTTPIVIQAAASHTADLLHILDKAGDILLKVDKQGNLTLGNPTGAGNAKPSINLDGPNSGVINFNKAGGGLFALYKYNGADKLALYDNVTQMNDCMSYYGGTWTFAGPFCIQGGVGESIQAGNAVGACLFLGNITTEPPIPPAGGGVLYVANGVLKYMGTSGTVTTLGPA